MAQREDLADQLAAGRLERLLPGRERRRQQRLLRNACTARPAGHRCRRTISTTRGSTAGSWASRPRPALAQAARACPARPPIFATPASVTFEGVGNFPAASGPVTVRARVKPTHGGTEARQGVEGLQARSQSEQAQTLRSACEEALRQRAQIVQVEPEGEVMSSLHRSEGRLAPGRVGGGAWACTVRLLALALAAIVLLASAGSAAAAGPRPAVDGHGDIRSDEPASRGRRQVRRRSEEHGSGGERRQRSDCQRRAAQRLDGRRERLRLRVARLQSNDAVSESTCRYAGKLVVDDALVLTIPVRVSASAPANVTNRVTVSGGGAPKRSAKRRRRSAPPRRRSGSRRDRRRPRCPTTRRVPTRPDDEPAR